MKSYNGFISMFFGILLISSTTHAQMDSLYSYYPLQNGNMWQYKETYYYVDLGSLVGTDTYYVTESVSGDTLLNNEKKYKIIQHKIQKTGYVTPSLQFQRIDSLSLQVFCFDTSKIGLEYLIDSLRTPVGSSFSGAPVSWIYFTKVVSVDSQYYFGIQSARRISTGGFPNFGYFIQTLIQGIGMTTRTLESPGEDMTTGDSSVDSLVYAKINGKEYGTLVSVPQQKGTPYHFSLGPNYPNPFNPTTTITFELPTSSFVNLTVYDCLGKEVSIIVNGFRNAGNYKVTFRADQLPSGIYFYRIRAGKNSSVQKMILLK